MRDIAKEQAKFITTGGITGGVWEVKLAEGVCPDHALLFVTFEDAEAYAADQNGTVVGRTPVWTQA